MSLTEVESQNAKWKTENNRKRPLPDYQGSRQGKRQLTERDGEDEHQEAESVLPVCSGTIPCKSCSTL